MKFAIVFLAVFLLFLCPINAPAQTCTATPSVGVQVVLKRVCTTSYTTGAERTPHNGAVTDLGAYLGGGTFPNFTFATIGYALTIPVGGYVSLAFVPATADKLYVQNNSTFGQAPLWAVSTVPGDFTGALGVGCQKRSASSIYFTTNPTYKNERSTCYLPASTATYYLNISSAYVNGVPACKQAGCASVVIGESIGISH